MNSTDCTAISSTLPARCGRNPETQLFALYNGLSVEVESETPGACVYSLRLGGRRAVTARQPRLQSESALEMNVKPYGDDLYLLTYNPEYASPADVNKIDLTYLFGGARVSRTIYFDPAEDRVAVLPKGCRPFRADRRPSCAAPSSCA